MSRTFLTADSIPINIKIVRQQPKFTSKVDMQSVLGVWLFSIVIPTHFEAFGA